jgi:hypothetical protein
LLASINNASSDPVAFVIENLRLKELAIVAEQNRPAFEYFVQFVQAAGYPSLQAFVLEGDVAKAGTVSSDFCKRHCRAVSSYSTELHALMLQIKPSGSSLAGYSAMHQSSDSAP